MGSSPRWPHGYVPTAAQWSAAFSTKQDDLGYTPVNRAGDTMSGPLVTDASTAARAGFALSVGVAPNDPKDGDVWCTTIGIFARANGETIGPISTGTVRSVGLVAPSEYTVTGSPVTGTGNLTLGWVEQEPGKVLAGPAIGDPDTPSFRQLAASDVPRSTPEEVQEATSDASLVTPLAMAGVTETANNALPASQLMLRANIIDFDYLRGPDDTQNMWPFLKALLENPSAERDALMGGAKLFFRGGRAYRALTRPLITLPQFLHMEMEPTAFFDFTDNPGQFGDNLMTYNGRYGYPTRPLDDDYPYGTTSFPFGSDVVASRGWKVGDRLLIRATEGLLDMAVGAFQMMEANLNVPATFSFFEPGATYVVGDGVISTANGKSYRCIVDHTSGETMNLAYFSITGTNATGEDVYVEAIVGDTIYVSSPIRYSYPEECRPIFTKYEDAGSHTLRDIKFIGNNPTYVLDYGVWATAQTYNTGEMVYASTSIGGTNRYFQCLADHTSGTFAVDRAAGKWLDLGSDRVFRFGLTDKVYLEGGRIERSSGYGLVVSSVADFVLRDFRGFGANKRSWPGGYLAISGAYNQAMIDNVVLEEAAQPFMTTMSGSEYGVSYGTIFRDCSARGGSSGFTQHWMEDSGSYINCEHVGSPTMPGTGSAFDIRTPSRLVNCRAFNFNGRALTLRHNFMGFGRTDDTARGTVIRGFNAHNCVTGIQLDNQMFNPGPGTMGWPNGLLEISDSQLTQIGGSGTQGAICLIWTQTDGVSSNYPALGRITLNDIFISMKSDQTVVRIAGRWDRPELRDIKIVEAPGFTPSGGFRSVDLSNGGVPSGENRPVNPSMVNVTASASFAIPSVSALFTNSLPSVASGGTLGINQSRRTFVVTGTTQINFIAGAGLLLGQIITLIFDASVTVSHNNGGAGGASVVLLDGAVNFSATAGDTLSLVSTGTAWREVGRAVI